MGTLPPEFSRQVNALTEELVQFHSTPTRHAKVHTNQWKPPPQDWVMSNFDASFTSESGTGGWGCIARDAAGDVMCAAAGPLAGVSAPLHAEATALMKAINLAESFGMGRAELGSIFRETKYYQLQLGFIEFKLVHNSCACNVPAHKLASIGSGMERGSEQVWLIDMPTDVMGAVAGDLSASTS